VDACSAKAYLETDLDENVRFYKKFGFEIISKSIIFHVENRYMARVYKHDLMECITKIVEQTECR